MNENEMAQKFLSRGLIARLPGDGETSSLPGAKFLNEMTGKEYVNVGVQEYNMFRAPGTNRDVLEEWFLQKPGINADRDAAGSDTYNTADAQLFIDANPNFEILGTNGTSVLCTFHAISGITLTTNTADADQMILLPHLNTNATRWNIVFNSAHAPSFETSILTGASVALTVIWAGFKLTNTPTIATDDDQIFFRYAATASESNTTWHVISSRDGTDTDFDTRVAVAAATKYNLMIRIGIDLIPRAYINGTLVWKGAAVITGESLKPYIGVMASGTTPGAKAITVRRIRCERDM